MKCSEHEVFRLPLCCGAHGDEFFRKVLLLHASVERLHSIQFEEDAIERRHYASDALSELSF